MNIVNDKLCTFCKREEETILHLFWYCNCIQNLLQEVKNVLISKGIIVQITGKDFIIGHCEKRNEKFYILCLQIKKYIFTCKRKEIVPTFYGLKGSLNCALEVYRNTNIKETERENWAVVQLLTDNPRI